MIQVFKYISELDAFICTSEYLEIAETLGLIEWAPVASTNSVGKLYDKVIDLLYVKPNRKLAREYANQLKGFAIASDPNEQAIFTQECLALAAEAEGNLEEAIKHRQKEIRLIRRLHELAQGRDARHADFIFGQYSYEDLSDRYDLLATLYEDAGFIRRKKPARPQARTKPFIINLGGWDWPGTLQINFCGRQRILDVFILV